MARIMWAIKGPDKMGFYTGTWLTKREAIRTHAELFLFEHERTDQNIRDKWNYCRRVNGDRCVKVRLVEVSP